MDAVSSGDALPEWRVTVDAGAMKPVALLLRDPNPIHWDVQVVHRLGLGDRPINQGPVNLAYVINNLIAWTGDAGSIRQLSVRFLENALAGDVVVAGGTVTAVHHDDSGTSQIAECEVWLDREDGTRLLQGSAAVRAKGTDK